MRGIHILGGFGIAAGALALTAQLFSPYRYLGVEAAGAATAVKARAKPRPARVAPLLGADGTPQPALPHAVPADPRERTRTALYATREQAQALEAELDGAVIRVETGCCDESAVSLALDLAEGLRSGRHLALDAPVFVSGKNLQLAAMVVDRLSDDGYEQVFLVTR